MKEIKSIDGQSLWEVVIALAIASLVAIGLIRVASTSIKGTRFSGEQSRMTAIAQKKITEIIDYKNKKYTLFWSGQYFPAGFVNPEYNAEGYCLFATVSDVSSVLPTETPNYSQAKMVKIDVKIFWDEKIGDGTQCANKNYSHVLNFGTYVTN